MRSNIRLLSAVVVAVVIAGMQAWGWSDAGRAITTATSWLWRAGWPLVRLVALPLAAAGLLYTITSRATRQWWREGSWRRAGSATQRAWLPLTVAGIIALLGAVILLVPGRLVAGDTAISRLTADQRAKAVNDARTALLQAVGGLLLAAGAVATWRQVRISREGQVTERFTRAVDQLGSEHLDVRLGALYALERIARDSTDDRRTIAEVLTAYIRQRAPWPPNQPGQHRADWPLERQPDLRTRAPDVQAAVTVLGRGPFPKPTSPDVSEEPAAHRLDLREVDLRNADLSDAHLEGTRFAGAHLEGADLADAHLEGAWLAGAHLQQAWLPDAHLERAQLAGAHLERASLARAHLERASLAGANLERAWLLSTHLEGAELDHANLEGARLADAHLQGAQLHDANLQEVQLDLTHLEGARATLRTRWPDGFDWRARGVVGEAVVVDEPGKPIRIEDPNASASAGLAGEWAQAGKVEPPKLEDHSGRGAPERLGRDGED